MDTTVEAVDLESILANSPEFAEAEALIDETDQATIDAMTDEQRAAIITKSFTQVGLAIVKSGLKPEQQAAAIGEALYEQHRVNSEAELLATLKARIGGYSDGYDWGFQTANAIALKTIAAVVNRFGSFTLTEEDRKAVDQLGGSDALVAECDEDDHLVVTYSLR